MPKNLEISGTNRRRLEAGERLLGLLSGDLHVEGVGAEIEPLAPDQFSGSTDLHLAKLADISPQGKDAFASHGGDIGHAGHAIGKFQAQLVAAQRFHFSDAFHGCKLAQTPRAFNPARPA